MSLPLKDHSYHTYGDYLNWSDEMRYELIDGTAYLMAPPAPSISHQKFVGEIYFQLRQALQASPCQAFIAPVDVCLPKADEADTAIDTVVQPDVLVVCDAMKVGERSIRGAPDWVAEVLSPTTAGHDHVRKRRIYERAGVREYWLVHPTDRIVTIYRLLGAEYGKPDVQELCGETLIDVLPGVAIVWDPLVT